jgi:hypothetical protein
MDLAKKKCLISNLQKLKSKSKFVLLQLCGMLYKLWMKATAIWMERYDYYFNKCNAIKKDFCHQKLIRGY